MIRTGALLVASAYFCPLWARTIPLADEPEERFVGTATSTTGVAVHLVPTIHLIVGPHTELPKLMSDYIQRADVILVEADPNDAHDRADALSLWKYHGDDSVVAHVSELTIGALQRRAAQEGLSFQQLSHLKPWAIKFLLGTVELRRAGIGTVPSAEGLILSAARSMSKRIEALETLRSQMEIYDTLPDHVTDLMLRGYLEQNSSPSETKHALEEITDTWLKGDRSSLIKKLDVLNTVPIDVRPLVDDALLVKRNEKFVQRLDSVVSAMHSGESVVMAVGVLHLRGDHGLLQLLKQRGYQLH
jgi:uncharacterized protein